ncbi:MAG: TrmH family RNA methyltransferase [Bacteroidales bacterium]|jgi:tRNA G18 (ribose-2'-O)-methylase SpoU|nr:TrmH family RNA methyltransferase [Bacteroidales bacterium]
MRKLRTYELGRLNPAEYAQAEKKRLIVALDNVRSGNNVGSVFRTCDAMLVEAVYLCGITATPPSPDIHKTALDAEHTVSWRYFAQTEAAIAALHQAGFTVYAVEQVEGSIMLPTFRPAPKEKIALVFGHEVKGVQQTVIDLCDGALEIPQFGTKHSFNIAVSVGIVLWDVFGKMG